MLYYILSSCFVLCIGVWWIFEGFCFPRPVATCQGLMTKLKWLLRSKWRSAPQRLTRIFWINFRGMWWNDNIYMYNVDTEASSFPFWHQRRTGVQYFLNVGDNFYPTGLAASVSLVSWNRSVDIVGVRGWTLAAALPWTKSKKQQRCNLPRLDLLHWHLTSNFRPNETENFRKRLVGSKFLEGIRLGLFRTSEWQSLVVSPRQPWLWCWA